MSTDRQGAGVPLPPAGSARDRLSRGWRRWGTVLAWLGIVYLIVAAAGRLVYAFPFLLTDAESWSALDLGYRYEEVTRWFAGLPVYHALGRLLYPPASYTVLWPLLGWLPFDDARILWAVTTLAASGVIACVAYIACRPFAPRERLLVALLAFAAYPVQMSVFVGQLPVHATALAAAAAVLLIGGAAGWGRDLIGSALLAASLVKPTLTVPIAIAILIATRRWRPAVLCATTYVVLAFAAAAFQPQDILTLHAGWLASTSDPVLIEEGIHNLHLVLSWIGREAWAPAASLLVLVAFAVWAWRRRGADAWLLIAAGALVARFWAYHREYDDVILVLVPIALLRAVHLGPAHLRVSAAVLLAASWAALLTPTWAFYDLPAWAVHAVQGAHSALWLTVLAFLLLNAGAGLARETFDADPAAGPAAVGAR